MRAHGKDALACAKNDGVRTLGLTRRRMNRRKADFKFAYKFLEDEV